MKEQIKEAISKIELTPDMIQRLAQAIHAVIDEDTLSQAFNTSCPNLEAFTPDYDTVTMFFCLYPNPDFAYSIHKGTLRIMATLDE